MSVYDEAHRQNILRQRESPHHSSGRTIRTWFYGPWKQEGEILRLPLVTKSKGLNFGLGKSGERRIPSSKEGFAQDFLLIQLQEEKFLGEDS